MLVTAAAFTAWWVLSIYRPPAAMSVETQNGGKDLQAYRLIVERVHQGENYYTAAGQELRDGGYATSSVFNWRLPTYAWLLAAFPQPEWGQALLALLALAALALAYAAERNEGGVGRAVLLMVLMLGAFLWCIDGDAFFSQELWAGVLITVSVGAFAMNQRAAGLTPAGFVGIAAGLAALFLRELAAPYILVAMVLACRERRWREVAAWCAGVAAFAIFFVWHAKQVQLHLTGSELAETEGWIQWGGPAFVIHACQMNVWLFNLPDWVALLFLFASLLGFAGRQGHTVLRAKATVIIYVLTFLIVGKSCNNYWGLLFVPLLPLGLVRLAEACKSFGLARIDLPRSVVVVRE
ncbi:MAG TPA: hypothetical protein VE988_22830 [Gemmataceae bacterium]|nr:hypothetical protein [Gemmataceae bacterium]